MKKIIIGLIICLAIIWGILFGIDYNQCSNFKLPKIARMVETDGNVKIYKGIGYKVEVEYWNETVSRIEMYMFGGFITGAIADVQIPDNNEDTQIEENQNIVKIVDGKIQNENLIDEFIEKTATAKEKRTLQIEVDDTDLIEVEFMPGEMLSTEEGQEVVSYNPPSSDEDFENMFGYYLLKRDGKETRFNCLNYHIARNTIDRTVYLIFDRMGEDKEDILKTICSYDLDSSTYKKDFELNFIQRKDMGADRIIEPTSSVYPYMIYTVGGDVTFTIDGDMVYDFKQALESGVITIDKILEQANMDDKYGICKLEMYSDGGTIEYLYDDYTIIKYSTLDGNEDFVIAPRGENIRNRVDKILYE